jgi:hypothetical protein
MKVVEIIEKDYTPAKQVMVNIFKQHAKNSAPEMPVIFMIPDIPNKIKTHIERIPCKTVGKQNGKMIITMKPNDYVRLMVKYGIEVKIYDKEVEQDGSIKQK